MKNKKKIAPIIIGVSSLISVSASILVSLIPEISNFLGKYIRILQIPWIIGPFLSLLGLIFIQKDLNIARKLIFAGAAIGYIVNALSFLALVGLRGVKIKRQIRKNNKPLVLPLLFVYFTIIMFIAELEDRLHTPLKWFGRGGLDLGQTLWDVDVFWGEFWFNLMIVLLISGIFLLKFPPWRTMGSNSSFEKDKKIFVSSASVLLIFLIAMLATWDYSFPLTNNWYETQFAYNVLIWPALVSTMYLCVLSLKKHESSPRKRNPMAWLSFGIFGGIFTYLSLITNFHPHVVLSLELPVHYYGFTIAVPFCLLIYVFHRIIRTNDLNKPMTLSETSSSKRSHLKDDKTEISNIKPLIKTKVIWAIVLSGSVSLIIIVQYLASKTAPALGSTQMFSMEFFWWWIPSHWPAYMCIICGVLCLVFGSRLLYRKLGLYVKENNMSLIPNQEKEKTIEKNRDKNEISHAKQDRGLRSPIRERIKSNLEPKTISKKVQVTLLLVLLTITLVPSTTSLVAQWENREKPMLLVNQVGYYPTSPKRLVFQASGNKSLPLSAEFSIFDQKTGEKVFSATLNRSVQRYGNSYMVGDFSSLNEKGSYYASATIKGEEYTSYDFQIAENIYDEAYELAFRFFYYQRCNYHVKEVVEGYLGHKACHMDDAMVRDDGNWIHHDLTGGWHDAGDYNKYNSWFQTQWYCSEAMAEAALLNPQNKISNFTNLYDSELPDAVDESLWGLKFLINCINDEAIDGEDKRYLVWESVVGYRQQSERHARMSYWGPPEKDWTAPRHVDVNKYNSTFVGYHRGYDIAATLLKGARLMDSYSSKLPSVDFPEWIETNTTYLRILSEKVYDKYLDVQGDQEDDIQSNIGKFFYWNEMAYQTGNFSKCDEIINWSISKINDVSTYPLWFGWAGYYLWGHILAHYLNHNRTVPANVMQKIEAIQSNNFEQMFDEPFRIKHVEYKGENVIFFGAERQTDMQTNVWIQALMSKINSTTSRLELVQSYLDWLFGVNPVGYCLMEGVGDKNLPQYHHRYSNAENPGGKVPGAIPNGIAQAKPTKEYMASLGLEYNDSNALNLLGDRDSVADWPENPLIRDGVPSNPNEVWIPHNAMMIRILTAIEQYCLF